MTDFDKCTKIGLVGDVHGDLRRLFWAVDTLKGGYGCDAVIQLGDFGIGFAPPHKFTHKANASGLDGVLLGNHDLQDERGGCPGWADTWGLTDVRLFRRGERALIGGREFLFLGGAESIDKAGRTPFRTWWPGETITCGQLNAVNVQHPTDVILSHTLPHSVIEAQGIEMIEGFGQTENGLQWLLSKMWDFGKLPSLWIGAHWHASFYRNERGVQFHCLDRVDGETPTLGVAVLNLRDLSVGRP